MGDLFFGLLRAFLTHVLLTELIDQSDRWTARLLRLAASGVDSRRRLERLAEWEAEAAAFGRYSRLLFALGIWWAYWLQPSLNRHWREANYTVGLPIKRALDTTFAAWSLVTLGPLLSIIALALWLERKGPILERKPVWGRAGQLYYRFRFRSTSPIGKLLDRTPLVALPTIWNVLNGDMSLVGPAYWSQESARSVAGRRFRPGLVGEWTYRFAFQGPEAAMELDADYATDWSLARDLVVVLSVYAVVFPKLIFWASEATD